MAEKNYDKYLSLYAEEIIYDFRQPRLNNLHTAYQRGLSVACLMYIHEVKARQRLLLARQGSKPASVIRANCNWKTHH